MTKKNPAWEVLKTIKGWRAQEYHYGRFRITREKNTYIFK